MSARLGPHPPRLGHAGNPVGLANPTLRRDGSTIPGYAVQQPPRNAASTSEQASSASRSTEISSSDSFAGKANTDAAPLDLCCIQPDPL